MVSFSYSEVIGAQNRKKKKKEDTAKRKVVHREFIENTQNSTDPETVLVGVLLGSFQKEVLNVYWWMGFGGREPLNDLTNPLS